MNTTINTVNIDTLNAYNNTPTSSKVCTKCNQIKPLREYNKDKSKTDGLRYSCKQCQSIAKKQYRDNNRQINSNKIYNENDVKTCSKCKKQKLYTEFHKYVTKSLGLESYCKDCKANDHKEYFRKQFSYALSKAIKDGNFSCLPLMGCDPHF